MWARGERDKLLGAPRTVEPRPRPPGDAAPAPWHHRFRWLLHGHLIVAVLGIVGWEHLDLLWPRPLLPDGVAVGAPRTLTGLLTVADRGRPVTLAPSSELLDEWRRFVIHDERREVGRCLVVPDALRARLAAGTQPRPGSAGAVAYWTDVRVRRRLGPGACGQDGGLAIAEHLERVEALGAVPCGRDAFVAHGFRCPGQRPPGPRRSETFALVGDYYPDEAEARGLEGTTGVRVTRDETGTPVDCRVIQSSGHPLLDDQTCKLAGTDPNFTPAEANAGDPTKPFTFRIAWRLPPEEPPSRPGSVPRR